MHLLEYWTNNQTNVTTFIAGYDAATGLVELYDSPGNFVAYPPAGYTFVAKALSAKVAALEARCAALETTLASTTAMAMTAIARLNAAGIS